MIKIAIESYPFYFYEKNGPKIFLQRMSSSLKKSECKIVSRFNPTYDIGLFASSNKSIFKKPYIIRIGGIYMDNKNTITNTELTNKKIFKDIENSVGVIFICDFVKKLVKKFYPNFNKPNIVVNNTVPLNLFNSIGDNKRNKLNIKKDTFVIVVSATWRRNKRLKEIYTFFELVEKKIKNTKLLILGDVENKKNNENIIYAGKVEHNELPKWYRTGNIYLNMAWIDHNPNTMSEAIACGLPSICCNNGGTKELVESCNAGIVSNADKEFNFDLVDYYNPPEPNYENLLEDFLKIYNNYESYKLKINTNDVDMNIASIKYLNFINQCLKINENN